MQRVTFTQRVVLMALSLITASVASLTVQALTTDTRTSAPPLSAAHGSAMLYDAVDAGYLRQWQLQDSAMVEYRKDQGCYLPTEWPKSNPAPESKVVSVLNPLRVLVWCEPFLATLKPTRAELNRAPWRAIFLNLPRAWQAELYRRGR